LFSYLFAVFNIVGFFLSSYPTEKSIVKRCLSTPCTEFVTNRNSSDTFTVTGKNSYKIAFGDEFLLAATTLSYGICSTVQIPA